MWGINNNFVSSMTAVLLVCVFCVHTPSGFASSSTGTDLDVCQIAFPKYSYQTRTAGSISNNGSMLFDYQDLLHGWVGYSPNQYQGVISDIEFEKKTGNRHGDGYFGRYQPLAESSITISMMAIGSIVVLYISPDNVSNWEEKDLSPGNMGNRYSHKIGDGPVIDKDDNGINYYGHPYFGGSYYIHSRHLGYNKNESFLFSLLMSTCMYEYGVEAFFERPSMQDLFVTPVLGVVHGEIMLFWERHIKKKNNRVIGSKTLGKVCLSVIDPIGFMERQIDRISALFPNTHMETNFFAYQRHVPFEIEIPNGSGGNREFRFGLEIEWYHD